MTNPYRLLDFRKNIINAGEMLNLEAVLKLFNSALQELEPHHPITYVIYTATINALAECKRMDLAREIYDKAVGNAAPDEDVHIAMVSAVWEPLKSVYSLALNFPINNPSFFSAVVKAAKLANGDNYAPALDAYIRLGENAGFDDHLGMIGLAVKSEDILTAETAYNRAKTISPTYRYPYEDFIKVAATCQRFDIATQALEQALIHKYAKLTDLYHCVKAFPQQADTLIQIVLNIHHGLKSIIRESQLEQCAIYFPNFAYIFEAGSVEDVVEAADLYLKKRSQAEIEKNAQYFLEARKTNSSFFPAFLEAEIASYTGEPAHTQQEAEAIAFNSLNLRYGSK